MYEHVFRGVKYAVTLDGFIQSVIGPRGDMKLHTYFSCYTHVPLGNHRIIAE